MSRVPASPDDQNPSLVGRKLGKYHILSRLGRGGMGVVYEAEDTYLKRRVAIKVLAPEIARDRPAVQRFLEEARSTAKLNHPNIVAIYEVDQRDGLVFLVMELVRGQNAQERINSGSPLDWAAATTITAQVCHALEAAHAAGLIHRDIKPSNILLARRPAAKRRASGGEGRDGPATVFGGADQTGLGKRPADTVKNKSQPADATDELVVKLVDFGLAKSVDPGRNPLTSANTLLGTPSYMSPEQCSSEPLDARSDVYSLGATYFALLTGRPPYVADAPMKVMFQHCSGSVPDPRSLNPIVPSVCGELIRRAMAREPSARFTSAHEMAEAFETALSQSVGDQGAAAVFGARPSRDDDTASSGRDVDAQATPPHGASTHDPNATAAGGLTLVRPHKGSIGDINSRARSRRKWLFAGAGTLAAAAVGIPLAAALLRDPGKAPSGGSGGGGSGGGGAAGGGTNGGGRAARGSAAPEGLPRRLGLTSASSVRLHAEIHELRLSRGLKWLAVGLGMIGGSSAKSRPPAVAVWDWARDELAFYDELRTGGMARAIAISPDEKLLAVAGGSSGIKIYRADGWSVVADVFDPNGAFEFVAAAPDNKRFVTCFTPWSRGSEIRIYQVGSTAEQIKPAVVVPVRCNTVVFSPGGEDFFTGGENKIQRHRADTGEVTTTWTVEATEIKALAVSPDGRQLAIGDKQGKLQLLDLATGKAVGKQPPPHAEFVTRLLFIDSPRLLASSGGDGSHGPRLWDLERGAALPTLGAHDWVISGLVFDPKRRWLLAGDYNKVLAKWELPAPK